MLTYLVIIAFVLLAVAIILYMSHQKNERQRYEFITIIAHKFRTPLTHIKWISEGLLEKSIDPYIKEDVQDIMGSGDHLIALTGTLIELTDRREGSVAAYRWERLDIAALAREVVETSKRIFSEKNLSLAVSSNEPEVFVRADQTHIRFALETVIENACLYSPAGKKIDVVIEAKGHKASILVIDHGIGIEARELPHIFDKFHRSAGARSMNTEGLGVGLYLTRSVIRQHKGKLDVYSDGIDQGTTVRITLPRMK